LKTINNNREYALIGSKTLLTEIQFLVKFTTKNKFKILYIGNNKINRWIKNTSLNEYALKDSELLKDEYIIEFYTKNEFLIKYFNNILNL